MNRADFTENRVMCKLLFAVALLVLLIGQLVAESSNANAGMENKDPLHNIIKRAGGGGYGGGYGGWYGGYSGHGGRGGYGWRGGYRRYRYPIYRKNYKNKNGYRYGYRKKWS